MKTLNVIDSYKVNDSGTLTENESDRPEAKAIELKEEYKPGKIRKQAGGFVWKLKEKE